MPDRRQKITLAEMRAAGVRGLLIYCSDFRCSHHTTISGDRWSDDVRLSDLEPAVYLRSLRPARRRRPARLAIGGSVCLKGISTAAASIAIDPVT